MGNLKFADTHNMVTFLSKPAESKWFEQIATVKAKTVNGEVQLQALVDGKKIIITESTVRRDLQLEDAEDVDCLPNATIFEQLALMSSKTTAWNEFSSTMASVIICLATNQKFNFSKFIFVSMVKNLDNVGKFLMYLRIGKGFSGREIPIFPTMVVHNQEEMGEGLAIPTDPHHTPTFIQPSPQPQKKQKPRKPKKKTLGYLGLIFLVNNVTYKAVYKERGDSLVRAATTASSLEAEQDSGSGYRRQETMRDTIAQTRFENVSKLSNDPLLARRGSRNLEKKEVKSYNLRGGGIHDIDADEDITLVNDDNEIFDVDTLAGEEVFIVEQSGNVVEEVVVVIDDAIPVSAATITYAKVEADYQLAQRLQAQEQEELTDEEKARTELVEESSKKAETKLEDNLKKSEAEVMEGYKPPTIVDWKILKEGKKSYYQIIRVDGKSQMYIIFSQMLKSFSREDLEDLYKLVKAKYGSTRPVKDLDLIYNGKFLKKMFEPHVKDQVWKNQDDYNVLDWNLYDSCGVHSLRMQHVYIHVLVEKRYPLTPSIITYMLNKKLQVAVLKMKWHIQLLKLLTKQLKNQ
ncbi:hypothetical protein Tco_0348031 [Tanacetum coccineum]